MGSNESSQLLAEHDAEAVAGRVCARGGGGFLGRRRGGRGGRRIRLLRERKSAAQEGHTGRGEQECPALRAGRWRSHGGPFLQ